MKITFVCLSLQLKVEEMEGQGTNISITKLHHRADEWVKLADIKTLLHCSYNTARAIVAEMQALEGKRYPTVTAEIGAHIIVDHLALNDYVRSREKLKAGLKVEPYNPGEEARLLGYYGEEIRDD